jgi:phage terminase small subunit
MRKKSAKNVLTERQKRFVQEYVKDFNGSQAAIRAGYSKKGSCVMASQLLIIPKVSELIKASTEKKTSEAEMERARIIRELKRIAFGSMKDIADWNGSGVEYKDSASLSDDVLASISSVEESTNAHGGSLKIKQHDKIAAMKLLGKHYGLFNDKIDLIHSVQERPHQDISDQDLDDELKNE